MTANLGIYMMYEQHFGLKRRPFAPAPLPENYVAATAIEHARQTLVRSLGRGEGPAVVCGPAGTGKSLLARTIATHFDSTYCTVLLQSARLDSCRVLLQSILFELHLPYRELEEGEMRLALIEYLRRHDVCPNGMLLIVDEAHTLPLRLLEEIRLITNLCDQGGPRVRLLLVGGPQLEERLAGPKLESFNQRIAARCYLQPLNLEETGEYIRKQIENVGGKPDQVFAGEVARAAYRATDGIPRLLNQVCDHALLMAFLNNERRVSAEMIHEAWSDLQQLPAPWQSPRHSHPANLPPEADGVIEFGSLSDDDAPLVIGDVDGSLQLDAKFDAVDAKLQLYRTALSGEEIVIDDDLVDAPIVSQPRPAAPIAPPVDVFGQDFEAEELVVDRYARLETIPGARADVRNIELPRPTTKAESATLEPTVIDAAELLATTPGVVSYDFTTDTTTASDRGFTAACVDVIDGCGLFLEKAERDAVPEEEPLSSSPSLYNEALFDPAGDPVLPELSWTPRGDLATEDDRDILLIEGARRDVGRTPTAERGKRGGEYRRLFASLRRR